MQRPPCWRRGSSQDSSPVSARNSVWCRRRIDVDHFTTSKSAPPFAACSASASGISAQQARTMSPKIDERRLAGAVGQRHRLAVGPARQTGDCSGSAGSIAATSPIASPNRLRKRCLRWAHAAVVAACRDRVSPAGRPGRPGCRTGLPSRIRPSRLPARPAPPRG